MHDPMVVVFDIPAPWVTRSKWREGQGRRWGLDVSRRTNAENKGQRVHPWYLPTGYLLKIAGRAYKPPVFATVWHHEPKGHDSGTICKGMNGTAGSVHNIIWAAKHWRHLSVQIQPYLRVRHWLLDHCAECGRRFRWKDARFSYQSSDRQVWHEGCMNLKHLRAQREDLIKHIAGVSDWNESWRAKRAVDVYLGMSEIDAPTP